jgi:hypothetical protein
MVPGSNLISDSLSSNNRQRMYRPCGPRGNFGDVNRWLTPTGRECTGPTGLAEIRPLKARPVGPVHELPRL